MPVSTNSPCQSCRRGRFLASKLIGLNRLFDCSCHRSFQLLFHVYFAEAKGKNTFVNRQWLVMFQRRDGKHTQQRTIFTLTEQQKIHNQLNFVEIISHLVANSVHVKIPTYIG